MNYRKLRGNDLADFAANLLALLAGPDLPAIDSHTRAELVTALGTMPVDLSAQTAAAVTISDDKKVAFALKDATTADILTWIGQVRDALRSSLAPRSQFLKAGFNYPFTSPTTYVAQDPSELSVTGFSNGVNKGRFKGNNDRDKVLYEIWRRQGDEGAWAVHTATKKQSFTDTGVTPGQYYEYRVRAVASKNMSQFSNLAVVYGVL